MHGHCFDQPLFRLQAMSPFGQWCQCGPASTDVVPLCQHVTRARDIRSPIAVRVVDSDDDIVAQYLPGDA